MMKRFGASCRLRHCRKDREFCQENESNAARVKPCGEKKSVRFGTLNFFTTAEFRLPERRARDPAQILHADMSKCG